MIFNIYSFNKINVSLDNNFYLHKQLLQLLPLYIHIIQHENITEIETSYRTKMYVQEPKILFIKRPLKLII